MFYKATPDDSAHPANDCGSLTEKERKNSKLQLIKKDLEDTHTYIYIFQR